MSEHHSGLSATTGTPSEEEKLNGKTVGNTSTQKRVLTRKEKLEAAQKANQAMMAAWQLISQRQDRDTDAESNV